MHKIAVWVLQFVFLLEGWMIILFILTYWGGTEQFYFLIPTLQTVPSQKLQFGSNFILFPFCSTWPSLFRTLYWIKIHTLGYLCKLCSLSCCICYTVQHTLCRIHISRSILGLISEWPKKWVLKSISVWCI